MSCQDENPSREQLHADIVFEEIVKAAEEADAHVCQFIEGVRFGIMMQRGDYADIALVLPFSIVDLLDKRLREYLSIYELERPTLLGQSALTHFEQSVT